MMKLSEKDDRFAKALMAATLAELFTSDPRVLKLGQSLAIFSMMRGADESEARAFQATVFAHCFRAQADAIEDVASDTVKKESDTEKAVGDKVDSILKGLDNEPL